jgi:hypothetical protein
MRSLRSRIVGPALRRPAGWASPRPPRTPRGRARPRLAEIGSAGLCDFRRESAIARALRPGGRVGIWPHARSAVTRASCRLASSQGTSYCLHGNWGPARRAKPRGRFETSGAEPRAGPGVARAPPRPALALAGAFPGQMRPGGEPAGIAGQNTAFLRARHQIRLWQIRGSLTNPKNRARSKTFTRQQLPTISENGAHHGTGPLNRPL